MARCVECGFVGLRNQNTNELEIADERFRREGWIDQQLHFAVPICARGVIDFRQEANPGRPELLLEAIQRDRPCAKAMQWHPALTPKEHVEMQMADIIREANDRREEAMREWQAREAEKAESRFQSQMKQGRWQIVIVGIAATIALALAQLFGSLIQAGWIKNPWQ